MESMCFIYSLSDPRTKAVRYVGKSKNLKQRLKGHMGRQRTEGMRVWIADLKAARLKPTLEVIEHCSECDGDTREIFHITEFRRTGLLLNKGNGGNGVGKHSAETKKKISLSNKVTFSRPAYRKAASVQMKRLRNSPDFAALVRACLSKPVLQLCVRTGKVLRKFPSITCAAEAVKRHYSRLAKVIKRGRTCAGFRWVYASPAMQATCAPWVPPQEIASKHAAAVSEARRKPVLQLSMSGGRVIKEFPSARAAALAVGRSNSAICNAISCQGTSAGFRWKYRVRANANISL
jgi:hypothetical protein